jgi:hypothetical protein
MWTVVSLCAFYSSDYVSDCSVLAPTAADALVVQNLIELIGYLLVDVVHTIHQCAIITPTIEPKKHAENLMRKSVLDIHRPPL